MAQKIMTCLAFNDRAEEAVRFYTSIVKNSKIIHTAHYGDTGPGKKGSVMAIYFDLNGQRFLALNGGPSFEFTMGMSLVLTCDTQAEIDEYWEKLSKGGEKSVCGWLTDKFGVSWQIVPAAIETFLSDPARSDRVMQAVVQLTKLDIATLQRAYEGA